MKKKNGIVFSFFIVIALLSSFVLSSCGTNQATSGDGNIVSQVVEKSKAEITKEKFEISKAQAKEPTSSEDLFKPLGDKDWAYFTCGNDNKDNALRHILLQKPVKENFSTTGWDDFYKFYQYDKQPLIYFVEDSSNNHASYYSNIFENTVSDLKYISNDEVLSLLNSGFKHQITQKDPDINNFSDYITQARYYSGSYNEDGSVSRPQSLQIEPSGYSGNYVTVKLIGDDYFSFSNGSEGIFDCSRFADSSGFINRDNNEVIEARKNISCAPAKEYYMKNDGTSTDFGYIKSTAEPDRIDIFTQSILSNRKSIIVDPSFVAAVGNYKLDKSEMIPLSLDQVNFLVGQDPVTKIRDTRLGVTWPFYDKGWIIAERNDRSEGICGNWRYLMNMMHAPEWGNSFNKSKDELIADADTAIVARTSATSIKDLPETIHNGNVEAIDMEIAFKNRAAELFNDQAFPDKK